MDRTITMMPILSFGPWVIIEDSAEYVEKLAIILPEYYLTTTLNSGLFRKYPPNRVIN